MKKLIITSILLTLLATGVTLRAQNMQEEHLGLPGDNLNLYAVMKLFQESETLEGFERSLNDENSKINNLDLNGDNQVDYIRVIDNVDGDVHNIVLQVAVNRMENQDVAVFTVQRDAYGKVYIQLTGDEALYGSNYIIEPIVEDADGQTPNPGYLGNTRIIDGRNIIIHRTTTYEIAAWPLVRFIYFPGYYPWRSSWYWGYYPSYWHPWQPFYWHYYYGYHYNWYNDYYAHYRHSDFHRYNRWHDYYWSGRRSHSDNVSMRIVAGNYKNSYSRPELRREGETEFIRNHPDQSRRTLNESTLNRTVRRSGKQTIQDGQSADNNATRRSTTTVSKRSVSGKPAEQNIVTGRRSSNTMTNRPFSDQPSDRNIGTVSRPSAIVTNRPTSNPPTERNEVSSRSSGKSAIVRENSSNRRSKRSSKSEVKSNRSEKTKSETTKSSRRQ